MKPESTIREEVEQALGLKPIPVTKEQTPFDVEDEAYIFYHVTLICPGHPYKIGSTKDGILRSVEDVGIMAVTKTNSRHFAPGTWIYSPVFLSEGIYYSMPDPIPKGYLGLSEEGKFYDMSPKPVPVLVDGVSLGEYQDVYHRIQEKASEAWGAFKAIAFLHKHRLYKKPNLSE